MTNSSFGRSSVSILGCEIPIITVPESVLPAGVMCFIPEPTVDMELVANIEGQNTTSRITIYNASRAMVLKVGSERDTKKKWTSATAKARGIRWKSHPGNRRSSGKSPSTCWQHIIKRKLNGS